MSKKILTDDIDKSTLEHDHEHENLSENEYDHRVIGKNLKLFFGHELSPGSPFFLPHGQKLYNNLLNYVRELYERYDYQEIQTPILFNQKLWEASGHMSKYKENIFFVDQTDMSLKPMNCPSHCLIFKHLSPSYKDLPIRLADFGQLHRNEFSGALTGLTRVRKFTQDDAHLFVAVDMIETEIMKCLEMFKDVYTVFGLTFEITVSTRPNKYIGDTAVWNQAEEILTKCVKVFMDSENVIINEGDGAFYGPKIDIIIKDSKKKQHQCGTVQLDFNLPDRFDLSYVDENQKKQRPIIIHRAVYGSIERFMAIILENNNGRLPIAVSPRRIAIIPISSSLMEYAATVLNELKKKEKIAFNSINSCIDINTDDQTLDKKILMCEKLKYNGIVVVGKREQKRMTINLRGVGEIPLNDFNFKMID